MAVVYEWKGKNPKGRKIKGEMEAESQEQVRLSLERRKITVTRVKKSPRIYLRTSNSSSPRSKRPM